MKCFFYTSEPFLFGARQIVLLVSISSAELNASPQELQVEPIQMSINEGTNSVTGQDANDHQVRLVLDTY